MNKVLYFGLCGALLLLFSFSTVFTEVLEEHQLNSKLPNLLGASNTGTEFVLGFHPCYESSGTDNFIRIYVSSKVETQVRLTIPYFSSEPVHIKNTKPNDIIEFVLAPATAQPYTRGSGGLKKTLLPTQLWKGRGIIINSDDPIVVYGVTRYKATSDGYLVLPTHTLGKQYIVSAYREVTEWDTQSLNPYVSIIGANDKTKVTFYIGGNNSTSIRTIDDKIWKPYQNISVLLNKGDNWLIASEGPQSDLGGSLVVANKPVAVISGNHCANVPTSIRYCDYLIEQELPNTSWGLKYFVVPIANRQKSSMIRVFSKEENTKIYRNGTEFGYLQNYWGIEGEGWFEVRASSDSNMPAVISSDKPIYVVQYNTGQVDDNVVSDPFQMVLTPLQQFQNEIIFNTPGIRGGYGFSTNYLSIVYLSNLEGQIPDDLEYGEVINGDIVNWTKVINMSPSPGQAYFDLDLFGQKQQFFVKTITLPYDGVYRLRCSTSKFAAYAYGFSPYDSYGFPTSVAISDLEKPDTLCPEPRYTLFCDGGTIDLRSKKTTGLVIDRPVEDTSRSNLSLIFFNKSLSKNYSFGFEDFTPGEDFTAKWWLKVINPDEDAKAVITFSDRVGNDTTITIEYEPTKYKIYPVNLNFGALNVGEEKTLQLQIANESKTKTAFLSELQLKSIKELSLDLGFYINIPFDINAPFQPGETRNFTVTFSAVKQGEYRDSIGVGDTCLFRYKSYIYALVGNQIINVGDAEFGKKVIGEKSNNIIVSILNIGSTQLKVTGFNNNKLNVFSHNLSDFKISSTNPLIIEKGGEVQFTVSFKPLQEIDYSDTIEILSDAGTIEDNLCILSGTGVQSSLVATGDNWGRKRAHLSKYDLDSSYYFVPYSAPTGAIELKNTGTYELTINKIFSTFDYKGEAFEIFINGKYQPIKLFTDKLSEIKDINGKSIVSIEPDGTRRIPVYFHPKASGLHKLVLQYESNSKDVVNSVLEGVGIYPKIQTTNMDFGTMIVGDNSKKLYLKFTNSSWEYQDSLFIKSFKEIPMYSIYDEPGIYSQEGFTYNKNNTRSNTGEVANFPIRLLLGDYVELECEFSPQKQGNASATLESVTDADIESKSLWQGYGMGENVQMVIENEPFICFNSQELIRIKVINQGESRIKIIPDNIRILQDDYNVFSLEGFYDPEMNNVDSENEYILNERDFAYILIQYAPNSHNQENILVEHSALVRIKTNALNPLFADISTTVKGRAIHFRSLAESNINNKTELHVEPIFGNEFYPITYTINTNPVSFNNFVKVNELNIELSYSKFFLALKHLDKTPKSYSIYRGKNIPEDWMISIDAFFDSNGEKETIKINLSGKTPLLFETNQEIISAQFLSFLPVYSERNEVTKSKRIELSHKISTMNKCLSFIDTQKVTITLNEICADKFRPILLSSSNYNLALVSPNPISSKGGILKFSIAFDDWVELNLYSITGELIYNFVSGNLQSGEYEVQLPIDLLQNGTYYIDLKSGEFQDRQKIIILK